MKTKSVSNSDETTVQVTGWLFGRLVFNGTFSTNWLYCGTWVSNISCRTSIQDKQTHNKMTKRSERRKHCTLAFGHCYLDDGATKFCPATDPFPGVWNDQNSISWRWSLPLPTNPVWWGSIDAISSYHGNRPTHTQTHTPTHRQDRLQYTAPQLGHSVTMKKYTKSKKS